MELVEFFEFLVRIAYILRDPDENAKEQNDLRIRQSESSYASPETSSLQES